MIIVYKEYKSIKYILLDSLTFFRISMMWHLTTCLCFKKNRCVWCKFFWFNLLSILHFPGSAPHYVFLWGFYYGLSHRTILLTCHNMLVHYYVYCWFDIIKSYGYELNKGLTFKIIPNEFKVRINEQVYVKKNHWWNK